MAISILSIAILAASSALACKGVIPNEFQRAQNTCLEKCHVADVACQTTCAQVQKMPNPAEDSIEPSPVVTFVPGGDEISILAPSASLFTGDAVATVPAPPVEDSVGAATLTPTTAVAIAVAVATDPVPPGEVTILEPPGEVTILEPPTSSSTTTTTTAVATAPAPPAGDSAGAATLSSSVTSAAAPHSHSHAAEATTSSSSAASSASATGNAAFLLKPGLAGLGWAGLVAAFVV